MEINYTLPSIGGSGGSRVILEFANRLLNRGHEVCMTSLFSSENIQFENEVPINSIIGKYEKIFYQLSSKLISHDKLPVEKLAKSLPDCDINIATYFTTANIVFRSSKGVPCYHMQHYEDYFVNDPYEKKIYEESINLPMTNFVNSSWLMKKLKEKGNPSNKRYLLNPAIDHQKFYPRKPSEWEELFPKDDKFRIVAYCSNIKWKGFSDLTDALKILRNKGLKFELYSFGRHNIDVDVEFDFEYFKNISDDLLANLYSSADLVVAPSWYESYPLPPIEAMACGTAVATTKIGVEDYIVHRKTGFIIPSRDPNGISISIEELMEDDTLRKKLSRNGRKEAISHTWEKAVDKLESYLTEIL